MNPIHHYKMETSNLTFNWTDKNAPQMCEELLLKQHNYEFDRYEEEPFDTLLKSISGHNADSFISVMIKLLSQIKNYDENSKALAAYCGLLLSRCRYLQRSEQSRLAKFARDVAVSSDSPVFVEYILLDTLISCDIHISSRQARLFQRVKKNKPIIWLHSVLRYTPFKYFLSELVELCEEPGFLVVARDFKDIWADGLSQSKKTKLNSALKPKFKVIPSRALKSKSEVDPPSENDDLVDFVKGANWSPRVVSTSNKDTIY